MYGRHTPAQVDSILRNHKAMIAKGREARPFDGTRTIAITSGKGGVGKSQLSSNLAVGLATGGLKVLLLDGDLGLASLDLALGVTPQIDLLDLMQGDAEVMDVIQETPYGVHLLPACAGDFGMANLDSGARRRLFASIRPLAPHFDVIVIDTGSGLNTNSVELAAMADEIILIVTPDPASMRGAYAMAKALHRRRGVPTIQLVANQVASKAEGAQMHARIAVVVQQFLALHLRYLGSIPHDANVWRAVISGEPYLIAAPDCGASRAVSELVMRLTATSV